MTSIDEYKSSKHHDSEGNTESFVQVLANSLYENLRSSLTPIEWRDVSRILARPGKRGVPAKSWKLFLECFQKKLPATTAIQIANVLTPILGTPLQPATILSFNAEAMLFALLNALTWARDTDFGRKEPKEGENRELLDPVTRSISDRNPTKVAYIFCHGLLPVPDQPPIAPFISSDKLVFSEASYLHLASTSFSWQSSAFLDVCSSKTVIFVGVSLADPNMRRWLSWIHENRSMEINSTASVTKVQGQHLWIRKRPKDDDLASWLEASVELLGVRIVWIEDWSQVESAIRAMLNP